MTTFLEPDEGINGSKSRRQRDQERVACFRHLRDLVYRHPEAAPASAVSVVRTLEAQVIAAKAGREKGRAEARAKEVRQRYGFG
jgi:predicted secreted Zn-dependent protease